MADYWKSQPRHFCEICKCWMAANQVSKNMHEQGGRHKANVEKRMRETSKRQSEERSHEQDVKAMLEEMNRGALDGMIRDLVDDPSIARRYGSRVENTVKGKDVSGLLRQQEQRGASPPLPPGWEKLRTDEGRPYYWFPETRHTQWERPLSSVESESQMRVIEAEGLQREEKDRIAQSIKEKVDKLKSEGVIESTEQESPDLSSTDDGKVDDDAPEIGAIGPAPAPSPFGQWEVVKVRPMIEKEEPEAAEKEKSEKEEPKVEPSERKLDFSRPFKAFGFAKRPGLTTGTNVAFKKRKQIGNRQLRSRDDDDE